MAGATSVCSGADMSGDGQGRGQFSQIVRQFDVGIAPAKFLQAPAGVILRALRDQAANPLQPSLTKFRRIRRHRWALVEAILIAGFAGFRIAFDVAKLAARTFALH